MFIVWGNLIRRRPRGSAPLFCPICRDLRTGTVTGVYSVGHVQYIPLGKKTHVMDELTCPQCKSVYPFSPRPLSESPEPIQDPAAALETLPPEEAQPLRDRLAFEAGVANKTLSKDDRLGLIAEPILSLAYEHDLAQTKSWHRSLAPLLRLSLLILVIATTVLWCMFAQPRHDPLVLPWAIGLSFVTLGLAPFVAWRAFTAGRRIASKRFIPRLADSLRPLAPKADELETTLAALRSRNVQLARNIAAPELTLAIESPTWYRAAA